MDQPKEEKKTIDKPTVPVMQLVRQDAEINHDYPDHIEAAQNVDVLERGIWKNSD